MDANQAHAQVTTSDQPSPSTRPSQTQPTTCAAKPPLTQSQLELADSLRRSVAALAADIGPRHTGRPAALAEAEKWITKQLTELRFQVTRDAYVAHGVECANLIIQITGETHPHEILIVGAHYDTAGDTPGANDNASGVAATLALAARFANTRPGRSLRLCFFVNEEPPHFQTESMGSFVYARQCQAREENIIGMISLETMGYYSDAPDSQHFPEGLKQRYSTTGNFVALVGNMKSKPLIDRATAAFRAASPFPVESLAAPHAVVSAGFSDHWSFWLCGYQGLMVTDTAMFRYPYYHAKEDTSDKLDYNGMARVVDGLEAMVRHLLTPQ